MHRQSAPTNPESDYAADDEPFLDLIPEKYEDQDLYEWKPAPEPISKPDEPGNMGMSLKTFIMIFSVLISDLPAFTVHRNHRQCSDSTR